MPIIIDPRDAGDVLGSPVRLAARVVEGPEPDESALDVLAAASRQATLPGSAWERFMSDGFSTPDTVAGPFEPLDHIAGFEAFADQFADAGSPAEVAGIKSRIRSEQQDRETLRRAGLGGPAAEIGMNLLDPSMLVSIAVPELSLAKTARMGRAVRAAVEGAAVASIYETGMQALQETRTATESAFNIGGGALFGGILGSLARAVPKDEAAAVRQQLAEEFINPDPGSQSFGAAASRRATTLEEEGLASGGATLSKLAGRIPFAMTDTQRVLESSSLEARRALQELVDVPAALNKNLRGEASPVSVETLIEKHMGRVADFATELKRAWNAYKARPIGEVEDRLTRQQFEEAVAGAARRGDLHPLPEVERAAKSLRERVFDPLKRDAQKLKLLPADEEINLFARSYFKRMYSRHQIRANRAAWDSLLTEHFKTKGLDSPEARAVADDITRQILGTDVGLANFQIRPKIANAGPLEGRVLDIPDEKIERFLENDPVKIASAYVREMAPQIEITKATGDKDARDIFQRVRDDYMVKRGLAGTDEAKLNALQDEEQVALDALSRIVLRLYGRAGAMAPEASIYHRLAAKAMRDWRNLVASAKLGSTALTGGAQDLSKIIGMYGFGKTLAKLTKLATSSGFRRLSKDNARRLGVATEVALARRVAVASDGAVTEGWSERLANLTFKASGLNHVTDMWRTLSATLIEDKILGAAADLAAGKTLAKGLRTDLAMIGLDADSLRRIAYQAGKHGELVDGVRTSGSMQWTDSRLAELYDSAIVKEARVAVMQPGAGDRVWWADGEVGKTLGQLKAFSLSAPLRMMMAPVQMLGQRRFAAAARLVGSLMVGGYLSHVFRQIAAGKEPVTDPHAAAGEAFAESGLGGILPDIASPFARRFGLFGESARFSDRNVTSAFGGPAIGTVADAYDVAMNRSQGGISASDLQAIRRLMPLQNLWWLRRAINALEGETAEAFDMKGSTNQSFGERMIETTPLPASGSRGGTGTGVLVQ